MDSDDTPSELKCFLLNDCEFKDAKDKPKVLKFTVDSLEKCRRALHVRNVLRIKYENTHLSSAHVDVYGYHSICKKNVTALSQKQIEKSEAVKPYRRSSQASSRSNSPMVEDSQNEAGTSKSTASSTNR